MQQNWIEPKCEKLETCQNAQREIFFDYKRYEFEQVDRINRQNFRNNMVNNNVKYIEMHLSFQIWWTALSVALGLNVRGDVIRGAPCIKRNHQLFCPQAGSQYPKWVRIFKHLDPFRTISISFWHSRLLTIIIIHVSIKNKSK